jgi:thiamine-monophosphate kinase
MTGEFAAIENIRNFLPGPRDDAQVWIGDDCAILPRLPGKWMLLAADTVVEGVHADLALTGIEAFGWKAMAACISDLAAMGADPAHSVVTVAGPPGTDLTALYRGLGAAAESFACPIVGGDLANCPTLVVTVAVTGSSDGPPIRRSGAGPDEVLWVTGPLGSSAAGLRSYRQGGDDPSAGPLRAAHARPTARLAAGSAARRAGATAMIDVSDGFAADLGHLADMSEVGFRLESLPVAPGATFDEALRGGEDYELIFSAPESAPVLEAFAGLATPLRLGVTLADSRLRLLDGRPLPSGGWEHVW